MERNRVTKKDCTSMSSTSNFASVWRTWLSPTSVGSLCVATGVAASCVGGVNTVERKEVWKAVELGCEDGEVRKER